MFNSFTINQDYKALQQMYMDLLQKKETLQRQVIIFRQLYDVACDNNEFNKHLLAGLVQELHEQVDEISEWEDTYERELIHNGALVNEINKLEEVVKNQEQVITTQAELLLLYKEKLSKGGKNK